VVPGRPALRIGHGREVIAEEHQNRDPVEGAHPGHSVNKSVRSDRFDKAHAGRISVANPTAQSSRFQSRAASEKTSVDVDDESKHFADLGKSGGPDIAPHGFDPISRD
jgi:hypothetical protein